MFRGFMSVGQPLSSSEGSSGRGDRDAEHSHLAAGGSVNNTGTMSNNGAARPHSSTTESLDFDEESILALFL